MSKLKIIIQKSKVLIIIIVVVLIASVLNFRVLQNKKSTLQRVATKTQQTFHSIDPAALNDPLNIQTMRKQNYHGSAITIEQVLPDGSNYHQYIASYQSQGLKIYGLLAIPIGTMPKGGWPAIIFNHGYIPPEDYQTDPSVGQYATYFPVFAENGYVVFKPDYRGNGNSQGKPEGTYYSPAYTTDDLNALSSIRQLTDPVSQLKQNPSTPLTLRSGKNSGSIVNTNHMGIWAHSMGGNIALRAMVVEQSWIKVAVIWGGVVGSYSELLNWHDPTYHPSDQEQALRKQSRAKLLQIYGTPQTNPQFWNSIDPTYYIQDITAPVQLDVGLADIEVPPKFSEQLYSNMKKDGKTAQLYEYPGDNHNISNNFNLAMQRSVEFFNKYLK